MGNVELGGRLKQAREQAGFTQSEVCKEAEIPKVQTLSAYERGVNSPPLGTLKKLAMLYKISTDWLLFGEKSSLKIEKNPRDYVEQLVDAADHLGLAIDSWEEGFAQEKVIVLRLLSSPYDGMSLFVTKWQRLRDLLDNEIIEPDEYEGLMRQRLNALVLTEMVSDDKTTDKTTDFMDDTERLPF